MPRTGKGGRRESPVGAASGNRTDLNAHVPIAVAPDQPYGEAAQQKIAQRTIPMAPEPAAPNPPAPAPVRSAVPLAQPQQAAAPGSLPWLEPTNRPNEPVTAMPPPQPTIPTRPVSQAFDQISQSANASPQVSSLADTARLLGL